MGVLSEPGFSILSSCFPMLLMQIISSDLCNFFSRCAVVWGSEQSGRVFVNNSHSRKLGLGTSLVPLSQRAWAPASFSFKPEMGQMRDMWKQQLQLPTSACWGVILLGICCSFPLHLFHPFYGSKCPANGTLQDLAKSAWRMDKSLLRAGLASGIPSACLYLHY